MSKTKSTSNDVAAIDSMREAAEAIRNELSKVIIGQHEVVENLLICIMARGHALLVGVPGLAKTLLIKSMSETLDLSFSRIQFTPDLMPSDITGTDLIQEDPQTGRRRMVFEKGPVFANIVLADEINRTPPKTQAALLEAMQEHRVTVQGTTYTLDEPFYVFATQNPIELEGTYPLPEAQLDRFMFEIEIHHLSEEEELEVVRTTTGIETPDFQHAVTGADLLAFQRLVRTIPVPDAVLRYAVSLVRASRPSKNGSAPEFVNKWIAYGASVRAAQYLVLGAKARALTLGRYTPSFEDVRALAHPVLRHRVLTNFHAESEGRSSTEMVDLLLDHVKTPASGL
ncbi:MAG: AAA family ATPase [Gemmatimonadetes bacterium]|nr:AAA family ATPase [Gemmatimonadota bacterium]